MFVVIHELSHCLAAELTGSECLGIHLLGSETEPNPRASIICRGIVSKRITLIAGSFISTLIAIIISIIAKKKNWFSLYVACSSVILIEFAQFGLSPLLEYGDAHMLLQTTEVDPIAFSVILLIITVFVFIRMIINATKIYVIKNGQNGNKGIKK